MINDIMSSSLAIAGVMEFVANSAVTEVAVVPPGVGGVPMRDANDFPYFEAGDNLLLTGVWVTIPYGFGEGEFPSGVITPKMEMKWEDGVGTFYNIPELASNSLLTIPNLCGPLEFPPNGLFIQTPRNVGRVRLTLTDFLLNVSQINLPSQLEGETIKVQVHWRITHTKPLAVIP